MSSGFLKKNVKGGAIQIFGSSPRKSEAQAVSSILRGPPEIPFRCKRAELQFPEFLPLSDRCSGVLLHFLRDSRRPTANCLVYSYLQRILARLIPYMSTAAALDALSELMRPYIGIDSTKSHFSFTRRPTPFPSFPITMAIGPVRFAS